MNPLTVAPCFSVIVPTYKRPQQLRACLEGLDSLDYPRDCYEVIVVDDGGLGIPEEVITSFTKHMRVRLLRVPHGGPAAARNAGTCEAVGEYLAFIDDDCVPAPDWLQALARGFSCAPDSLTGGHTVNALPDNPYSAASQLLVDYLYDYYGRPDKKGLFFTSNNLAVHAEAFRSLGGFDVSFTGPAGEDREFCDRWVSQGRNARYVPDAVVYHAHALALRTFHRQHTRYGRAAYRFHRLRALRASRKSQTGAAIVLRWLGRMPLSSSKNQPPCFAGKSPPPLTDQ